jgi:hypothetical protein
VSLLPLLEEVAHLPPDEAVRLGRGTLRAVQRLVSQPGEGAALWKRFMTAGVRARTSTSPHTVLEFSEAVADLEKRVAPLLTPAEFQLFRNEVDQQVRTMAARAATAGVPMPDFARFRRILTDANRSTLLVATAQYQDSFLQRLGTLAASTPSATEELAIATHRQMLVVVGDQGESGWGRVFTYCAKYKRGIARASTRLRAARAAHVAAPTAANASLLRLAERSWGGYLYPIRGELAEIYVNFWPAWRIQRDSLMELATATGRRLGRGWRTQPFAAGALIDGKKAWDEGVLLLRPSSASDRLPRAVLHSAAQVKVQPRVTALTQVIKDRTRERGAAPILTVLEGNQRRDFRLEPLPPSEEVIRYVFHARGGSLSPAQIARLKAAGIEVTAQALPLSVEAFNALAGEIMFAAL